MAAVATGLRIERAWAMPSKHTFTIPPIADLLKEEMHGTGRGWVDPFAGWHSPAWHQNDLDPAAPTPHHLDALEYLQKRWCDLACDGVLFDPPYSPRQVSECYKRLGKTVNMATTQARYWSDLKDEIARVLEIGGKCITCAWNSGGIGESRGFEKRRILLIGHGGWHNDTIVTVEVKVRQI